MVNAGNGETSKQQKVTQEKGPEEERQKSNTKDDELIEPTEHSSLDDETTERPSERHLGDKCGTERKVSCTECGFRFSCKSSLRRHLVSVHKVNPSQLAEFGAGHAIRPPNPFKCDKCMKTYKSKTSLLHHMRNECRVDPAFPCSQCSYKATSKSSIRRHLIHVHNVDRSELDNFAAVAALCVRPVLPFKCEKCGRTYKSKGSLYEHGRVQCGVDPSFFCTQCDYRTSKKSNHRRHLISVHNVELSQLAKFGAGEVVRPQLPFKCDTCERSYKSKNHLKCHVTFECGVIPSFPCNKCGYRAARKGNLTRHINAVHGASSSSLGA